jgi:rRNA maturation RNase YbeY
MSGEPPFPNAPTGVEVDTVHPGRSLEGDRLRRLVRRVAEGEDREIGYLSIVLADHETVTRLNREYLGHDYETDVLSFPLTPERSVEENPAGLPDETRAPKGFRDEEKDEERDEEHSGPIPPVRGEIYVDLDTAAERAPEFETTFEAEAARYLVHGLLHLMGYDDQDEESQRRMRELEDRYLDLEGS